MKIAIASDHGGFTLKQTLIEHIKSLGHTIVDLGTDSTSSVDYPDFAHKLANEIQTKSCDLGVLICGTGIGMEMTANRHGGVRAANCTNTTQAKLTREHNNANVLCLGARIVGEVLTIDVVNVFLTTQFEGGRHEKRVEKIDNP